LSCREEELKSLNQKLEEKELLLKKCEVKKGNMILGRKAE
jgi:hypothetical protein